MRSLFNGPLISCSTHCPWTNGYIDLYLVIHTWRPIDPSDAREQEEANAQRYFGDCNSCVIGALQQKLKMITSCTS
ncbi:hypothetical protein X777_11562 [Ooceraea biroi]|uniref:Uncharacterized protein n=1 Tax=Ooceraea biroi TaxID=2015173 RepID=A0A026W519_OOCBI|nr:hypothetical protein X777_11562 [Ooceraea biroi]